MTHTVTRLDGSTVDYLSTAETARLVRRALARAFPATKFYVRSQVYSGGASIDVYYDGIASRELDPSTNRVTGVRYHDGAPTSEEVERVAKAYAGGGFDGMIDLAYGVDVFLDGDGNVVGSESRGTAGSHGSVPAWSEGADRGRRVSPGADYIFVNAELPYDVRAAREGR